jgi:hypothetical protein
MALPVSFGAHTHHFLEETSVLSRRFVGSLLGCGMSDGRGPKLALLELTQIACNRPSGRRG